MDLDENKPDAVIESLRQEQAKLAKSTEALTVNERQGFNSDQTILIETERERRPKSLWSQAYDDFKVADPDLFGEFSTIVNVERETNPQHAPNGEPDIWIDRNLADVTLGKVQALVDQKVALQGKSARFRKLFEETVRLIVSATSALSTVKAIDPHAAAACTAVSVILPLLLVSAQQNEAALEGLNYVAVLIVEYRWKERCYLSQGTSEDFSNAVQKLYSSILSYEAMLYVHIRKNAGKRLARNILKAGDWEGRLKTLKTLDSYCRKITDAISESRSLEWRTEERQWQHAMLDQPRREAEKTNLRKLYSRYESAKNINPLRVPGTLEWFLKYSSFLSWRAAQYSGALWLTSDPGCGKSVLSKYLVDRKAELLKSEADDSVICYYFFRRGDAELSSAAVAIKALLHQLFTQRPHLYKYAAHDFEEKGDKFLDDFDTLWQIFVTAIDDSDLQEVICVLDALDECQEHENHRKKLIRGLVDLQQSFQRNVDKPIIKILLTSRPYAEIEREFRDLTSLIPGFHIKGEKETDNISAEVNIVLEESVPKLARKLNLPPRERNMLYEHLFSMSNRTYLWLKLALEFLDGQVELDMRNIPGLLKQIPCTVDEAYNTLLQRSNGPRRAQRLLHYILGASTPLSPTEINILMNIDETCRSSKDLLLWPVSSVESTVKNICGLFVRIVDDKIHLIHPTARDFLEANPDDEKASKEFVTEKADKMNWKHAFHTKHSSLQLAEACVSFLSLEDFHDSKLALGSWRMRNVKGLSLFSYAARNWSRHFNQAGTLLSPRIVEKAAFKLFNLKDHVFDMWTDEYRKSLPRHNYLPFEGTSLMWAASFGQLSTAEALLKSNPSLDLTDRHGRTAMFFAAYAGHDDVVQLLLRHGAKVDMRDVLWQTPLHVTLQQKSFAVAELLLEAGAQLDSADAFNKTAASYGGTLVESLICFAPKKDEPVRQRQEHRLTQEPARSAKALEDQAAKSLDGNGLLGHAQEAIRVYVFDQHNAGNWSSLGEDQFIISNKPDRSTGLGAIYDNLCAAVSTLSSRDDAYEEGRGLTFSAFAKIDLAVRGESPLLLLYIPRTLGFLWTHEQPRLAQAIAKKILEEAQIAYNEAHPLISISSFLYHVLQEPGINLFSVVVDFVQSVISVWTSLLGENHLQVLYAFHVLWVIRGWFEPPQNLTAELIALSQKTDATLGEHAPQSTQILVDIARNQVDCQEYQPAMETAKQVCSRVAGGVDLSAEAGSVSLALKKSAVKNPRTIHMLCEGLQVMGEAATHLGKLDEADESFRKAVKIAQVMLGEPHARARELRRLFGHWLKDRGRDEEATEFGIWK